MKRISRATVTWTLLISLGVFASSTQNPSSASHLGPDLLKNSSPETETTKVLQETSTATKTATSSSTKRKKQRKNETARPKKKPTKLDFQSTKSSATLRRIKTEYKNAVQMGICYDWVKQRPVQSAKVVSDGEESHHICLGPLATNLRHWHFSFVGCGVFENGVYHGRILLPKDYPATPPRISLWTPSGRFIPYHDICLSASSYHPESWTPRWTVLSLVQALRLHMLTNPQEIGGIVSTREEILEYAKKSLSWKKSWKVNPKMIISVDHELILQQGILSIEEEEDSSPTNDLTDHNIEERIDITSQSPKSVDPTNLEASVGKMDGAKKKKAKKKGKRRKIDDSIALQKQKVKQDNGTVEKFTDFVLDFMLGSPIRVSLCLIVLLYWTSALL